MNQAAVALLKQLDAMIAKPVGPGGETPTDRQALALCYREDRAAIAAGLPAILAEIETKPLAPDYPKAALIPAAEVQAAKNLASTLLNRSRNCLVSAGYAHFSSWDDLFHSLPKIEAEIRGTKLRAEANQIARRN